MDTPCRSAKRTHSAAEQVVRRALFAPSPCSRGVASETGGAGASPRKAFQLQKLWPKSGEAAHFASEAANSRGARGGGLAISARGVSPQRRRVANATQIFQVKKHLFNEANVPFKKGKANEIVGRIDSALDERSRPYIDCIRLDGRDLCRCR